MAWDNSFFQDGATQDDPAEPKAADGALEEEIVVTARKREEALADVPIAITLLSGEMMQESNISDLSDLSLTATNSLCTGGNTNPLFRGLQRHGWSRSTPNRWRSSAKSTGT